MAHVANAVTLRRWLQQCVPAALRALMSDVINLELIESNTVWL
jgi:glucan phosphorylase